LPEAIGLRQEAQANLLRQCPSLQILYARELEPEGGNICGRKQ